MSDLHARLEEVRAAGRRLDAASPPSLTGPGPIARNGQAQGGWLKTLFGRSAPARAEAPADRAAYLLLCQSVVAAHVIERSETVHFPRDGRPADYQGRQMAISSDAGRPPRNTAKPVAVQDLRTVFDQARPRGGLIANLANFLK